MRWIRLYRYIRASELMEHRVVLNQEMRAPIIHRRVRHAGSGPVLTAARAACCTLTRLWPPQAPDPHAGECVGRFEHDHNGATVICRGLLRQTVKQITDEMLDTLSVTAEQIEEVRESLPEQLADAEHALIPTADSLFA